MENMNANAAKANELMNLARNTYIGIDTNIFMHASADAFFSNLERTLNELNRAGDSGKRYRVFTIGEVKAELEKQSRVPGNRLWQPTAFAGSSAWFGRTSCASTFPRRRERISPIPAGRFCWAT